jgi:hypothetical protein
LFLRFQKRPAVVVHLRHPIHATRGASAALLAKKINKDAHPVATSRIGLGFRSFSPIASQSIPPASSNLFLYADDLPPRNQLEAPQIVIPDTMLPSSSSAMQLSEVMLPLSTMQMNTAYSFLASHVANVLLCEHRRSRYHGGVGRNIIRR